MKTASPGLLEVMVVRVNAGGNAPSDPPSLVTSWAHPFQKSFLANERENIFGGKPLRSSRCLVHILKSSTCKHVKSGQERETETDRTLRAARFRRYINLQKNKLDCTSIDGVKHVAQIASSTEVDMDMVRACVQVLRHHGVLAQIDIFWYHNVYGLDHHFLFWGMTERRQTKLLTKHFGFPLGQNKFVA
jgi:hypothetical protein